MRATITVEIEKIDHGDLPNSEKVRKFRTLVESGYLFPPVRLERVAGGRFKLSDGRNRLAAHKLAGKERIRANVAIKEDPYPYKPLVTKEQV